MRKHISNVNSQVPTREIVGGKDGVAGTGGGDVVEHLHFSLLDETRVTSSNAKLEVFGGQGADMRLDLRIFLGKSKLCGEGTLSTEFNIKAKGQVLQSYIFSSAHENSLGAGQRKLGFACVGHEVRSLQSYTFSSVGT
jgi:hypothetical protein